MSNNSNLILEVKNLQKHFPIEKSFFGKDISFLKAVDNVSFKLEKGKTIGIVGESGCGKQHLEELFYNYILQQVGNLFIMDIKSQNFVLAII